MKIKTIIASEVAALDSDVRTGGGTDATEALQAALDEALAWGGVRLVMDGAALVRYRVFSRPSSGKEAPSATTLAC